MQISMQLVKESSGSNPKHRSEVVHLSFRPRFVSTIQLTPYPIYIRLEFTEW